MPRKHARLQSEKRGGEARVRIAQEAARLMAEDGIGDFAKARRKAAERYGVHDEAALPSAAEIDEALREFQRLFRGGSQPRALRERREAALEAMRFFAPFEPRLVGAVLDGTADEHSVVVLHLHSDDAHAVPDALERHRIPYETRARRLRSSRERADEYPVYAFTADELPFEIVVLPHDALRHPPLDRADDKPVERASITALQQLLR